MIASVGKLHAQSRERNYVKYLVPMAAEDDLFPRSEYHFPKLLIEIDGVPMVERFIRSITAADPSAEFVFVLRGEHCRTYGLDLVVKEASDGRCVIFKVEKSTAGAVCTALLAVDVIDNDEPLVICNGDQIIEEGIGQSLACFAEQKVDAGVVIFPSIHPRWSYARLDERGCLTEAAEKRVISRTAIAGFYYFASGRSFVEAAKAAIVSGRSVNGVYYVSLVLNELVLKGLTIGAYEIATESYQSLYSPQRLENYERQVQKQRLDRGQAVKHDVTVVIPMAGLGSRFSSAGYVKPKPFIDVAGKPMIERVMDNLQIPGAKFVLIARKEHLEQEPEIVALLKKRGDVVFVPIDAVTEGAACTVLTAARYWDSEGPLLIANCDQIVDFSCDEFISDARKRGLSGSILTFVDNTRDPKWSFAKLNDKGYVEEVKEKVAISDLATVGLYYFSSAKIYTDSAIEMIVLNERVNNEFYVCPVYNYAIRNKALIGVYNIASDAMHGIGTPDDLQSFLKLRYSQ
jgi:NDP-sugar pyrophosphorylase family protein